MACRMSELFNHHIPVLLAEAVDPLVTQPSGIYIDATFGRGSHSQAILQKLDAQGRLYAFDKDLEAVQYAKAHVRDGRFKIFHASYMQLQMILQRENVFGAVDGILFDLGVSSPQLDNPERGFSFMRNGALDMRMDTTRGESAATWLQNVDETTLARVLWEYGEEKCSRRIARAVVSARQEKPITTTNELAKIIASVVPRKKSEKKHPATRSFQAIRIAINDEMNELEAALKQALAALKIGGRLAVISFHSLEDRLIKHFIRKHEKGEELPPGLPVKGEKFAAALKSIGKPVKATEQQVEVNPRARSAILRIAEKIS